MAPASASGFKETSLKQAKTQLPPVDRETITSVLKRVIAENGRAHLRGYIVASACLALVAGTTAFGKSLVVPYSLTLPPGTIQGRSILLETPDGIATLTVSHASKAEADKLTKAIVDNVATL